MKQFSAAMVECHERGTIADGVPALMLPFGGDENRLEFAEQLNGADAAGEKGEQRLKDDIGWQTFELLFGEADVDAMLSCRVTGVCKGE